MPLKLFDHGWRITLWLAPLCAIVASSLEQSNPTGLPGLSAWLLGIGLLIIGGLIHDGGFTAGGNVERTRRWTPPDWLAVILLGLIAFILRIYWLDKGLPYMHGDEGEMGQMARLAVLGPAPGRGELALPFFRTGWLDHPTLFHYIQGWFLLWFGNDAYSLKLLSALAGALCVPVIYAAGRIGWGWVAGLTAAWLLAVSHLHIHFSRLALNNIESVLFGAIFLLIALIADVTSKVTRQPQRSLKIKDNIRFTPGMAKEARFAINPAENTQRLSIHPISRESDPGGLTLFVALGLTIGLSQYFYFGSRLLPVVTIPILILFWRQRRIGGIHCLGVVLAVFVSYWPLAAHYLAHGTSFLSRTISVSILSPHALLHALGPAATWPSDIPALLLHQVQSLLGFLIREGDRSAFYVAEIPAFDPITATLFWLGIGILIANSRRIAELIILIFLGLGLILAGVLTNDAPNAPRLIIVLPALVLACGVATQKIFDLARRLWPTHWWWLATGLGIILIVSTLIFNFDAYFRLFLGMQRLAVITVAAEQMQRNPAIYRAYLLGAPVLFAEHGVMRFIAEDTEKIDVIDETQLRYYLKAGLEPEKGKGSLYVVLPHRFPEWEAVSSLLPPGAEESFYNSRGELILKTYRINPR